MKGKNETIVFGGGCFWCTQAVFRQFKGVINTIEGYAGGTTPYPSLSDVYSGKTGHAEVLWVEYDPKIISTEKLLEIFFSMHDPTSLDRQGNDVGMEYRSIILYNTEEQKKAAKKVINKIKGDYSRPLVTELKKLDRFYPAEEYTEPYNAYCTFVINPKVAKIRKEFALLLK